MYLLTSLHTVIKKHSSSKHSSYHPLAPLLATHIALSARVASHTALAAVLSSLPVPPPSSQLPDPLKLAEKYTTLPGADTSALVWLARLNAARVLGWAGAEVDEIWKEARRKVRGDVEGVVRVWVWGVSLEQDGQKRKALLHVSVVPFQFQLAANH